MIHSRKDPISVLHVDDEPDFAELVSIYFQREDDGVEIESVTSASDGLARLSETPFDCVVSDFNMPGQNGIELLEAVRKEYPELPFILFTGKGSEEVASDAISAGVTEYLQKGNGTHQYTVLANRIRNVVEKWHAEQEAERVRTRLRAITANSNDAILTIDTESTIQFVNQAAEELFGYEPDSLIGESLRTLIPPRYRDKHLNAMGRYVETNQQTFDWTAVEFSALHRHGHEIPVSVSFSTFEENGKRQFVGVLRDISNRVRMEDELREREQRFRQMAENIKEMVWMSDPNNGEVLYVNPAYREIWGKSAESLYEDPQSFLDAVHPGDRARVRNVLDPQTTGSYEEEYRIVRPDGEIRWVHDRAVSVKNEAGKIYRTVGIASDITDRKAREQKHDRVLELLDHTEQIADVGGWEIDTETRDVFWSDHLFEMLEWEEAEEPPLEAALDVYVEQDRSRVENAVEAALEAGDAFSVEARFQQAGGDIRWFEIRGDPRLKDGEVVTLRGAVHDITERKRRERTLREIYEIASDTDRSFPDKVHALLELGRRELDTGYGTLLRICGDEYTFEFVESDDDSIQPGDVVPLSTTNCESVASTEQTVVIGDVERDAPEETDRVGFTEWGISCYIGAPVFTEDGIYGTFCFYHTTARTNQFTEWEETLVDLMSNLVSGELQRQQVNERFQSQNEQLDQFASVVSHDLRNPLSVAEGQLDLAQQECESEHLCAVSRAHERMSALIDDLLTLAREGEQIGAVEPVDLMEVTNNCWKNVATAEATLNIDVGRQILADRSRLQQLVENVISNAIKHSGEAVSIAVGELDDGFFIEDSGRGIPVEDREAVFEGGYSTSERGTGFGLNIVKDITQAHGWAVRVTESSEGGARFEFRGVEFSAE